MKYIIIYTLLYPFLAMIAAEGDIKLNSVDSRLFNAIRSGTTANIASAVSDGADLNKARDEKGRSPLFVAKSVRSSDVFEFLLQGGADPNAETDRLGNTVLAALKSPDSYKYLELFMRFGGDINLPVKSISGSKELYLISVSRAGHLDLVSLTLKSSTWDMGRKEEALLAALGVGKFQVACFLDDVGVVLPQTPVGNELRAQVLSDSNYEVSGSRVRYWRKQYIERIMRKR